MAGATAELGGIAAAGAAGTARGARRRPDLRFATIPSEAAGAVARQWASLAERAVGDNVFFHPDFAVPAMDHLGGGAVAVATVARSTGRLLAAAPFTRARLGRIAPAVRLWRHAYGPLGLPLVDKDAVEEGVAALVEGLVPDDGGGNLLVPDLPLDGPLAGALSGFAEASGRPVTILDRQSRAVLERPANGAVDVLSGLSTRRRKEYGRQMRRLGDVGRVSIETVVEPDRVRARFEEFLALEAAGWKGRRGTALASSPATAGFARAVVSNRAEAGAARIDSIRVDQHPIAIIVCFVAGRTAFTWKIAYDEAYARFSPGAHLMMEVAKNLFSDPAFVRIDSCADADHPMVDHLWPGRMAIGTMVVGPPGGGVIHRLGVAVADAEIAAIQRIRRLRNGRH